jgi:hypothetical protein
VRKTVSPKVDYSVELINKSVFEFHSDRSYDLVGAYIADNGNLMYVVHIEYTAPVAVEAKMFNAPK